MKAYQSKAINAKAAHYLADEASVNAIQELVTYFGGEVELTYDGFRREHTLRARIPDGGIFLIKYDEWFLWVDGVFFTLTDKEFKEHYEESELPVERQSNLVDHAKRELDLVGEQKSVVEAYLKIVRIFADMGHSGSSAMFAIPVIEHLLAMKPLSALTNDPEDWIHVGEDIWGEKGGIYQNRRNGEAFSKDGGKTYYLLSDNSNAKIQTKWYTAKEHKQ